MWAETLLSILSLLIRLLMLVNSSSDNTSVSSNLLSQAWIKERKKLWQVLLCKVIWISSHATPLWKSVQFLSATDEAWEHENKSFHKMQSRGCQLSLSQLGSVMLVLLGGWTKNYSNVWASWGFFCGIDDRLTGSVSSVLSGGTCPISLFTLMFINFPSYVCVWFYLCCQNVNKMEGKKNKW